MNTKHLKSRILDLAIKGKLVENSKIPKNSKSRIPTDFKPPFEIPNSWEWVKLGDIGTWKSGATPRRTEQKYFNNGTINWLKTGDLNDDYIYDTDEKITDLAIKDCNLVLHEKNTILIAMYGATTGKIGIANIPLTTNQACCACKCNEKIFYKFLYFLLLNLKHYFTSIAFGGAQPNISKEKIINTYIALPPLDEQERIVKKLDEIFSQIDILDKHKESLLKNIKHTKSRILDLAIKGKLVENSKISKNSNSKIPTDFEPPFEIPNSWEWVKLGDICDFQNGFAFKSAAFKSSGYFIIKITNIQNNEITKNNAVFCEPKTCENLENFSVKKGDILIAMSGATTGKIGIYNLDEIAFLNQRVGLFKNFSKNIDKRFFYFVLLTKVEESLKIAIGSAQPNLSTEQIKNFFIPLPPLDEQERIVKKLDELFVILDEMEDSLI